MHPLLLNDFIKYTTHGFSHSPITPHNHLSINPPQQRRTMTPQCCPMSTLIPRRQSSTLFDRPNPTLDLHCGVTVTDYNQQQSRSFSRPSTYLCDLHIIVGAWIYKRQKIDKHKKPMKYHRPLARVWNYPNDNRNDWTGKLTRRTFSKWNGWARHINGLDLGRMDI